LVSLKQPVAADALPMLKAAALNAMIVTDNRITNLRLMPYSFSR